MKTAELKVLPVTVLKPAEYNPRKKLKPGDKEYEKIKNSIEEFGFADPLVVNADMTIIHHRWPPETDCGPGPRIHGGAVCGGGCRQDPRKSAQHRAQ